MTTQSLQAAKSLRNLYFVRTIVQVIWAGAVIGIGLKNPTVGAMLLILYPLWDIACTLYDLKTSAGSTSVTTQYMNVAVGVITAIAIGVTAYSHIQYAVAAFGGWALVAGLLQLCAGIVRKQRLGGQWAMILSGAQSMLAGVAFTFGGLGNKLHIKDLAGYAIFGAVYFLVAAVLLNRRIGLLQTADRG
jgi:hypothetical protein